jgi:(p)ppGpp synthase/HD superfamily hydrolase
MTDSLQRIREQPREIWVVKLADRVTNLQSPPAHWSEEKVAGYRVQAVQIRDALGEASDHLRARLDQRLETYPPSP